MAERNGRVEITAEIDQRLQSALSQMSSSLRSTIEVTNAVNRSTDLTKSTMRGLSQALTVSRGSTNEYNRSVTEAVKNQAILASHFGRTKEAITSLNRIISSSRGTNVTSQDIAVQRAFINQLEAQLGVQKELQRYSNTQSLMAQSNALNSLATKYSYAGNRLSMGLTLPLMTFFRSAFSNYRRLEIETVRTTKLLGDSYTDAGAQVKTLGKELDSISLKYGVARDLVQGLAGDYAELGITDIKALAGLTDLTAATEKLGNVDITEASNFIKSIYQTVNRVKRDEAARAGKAISFKDPAEEALFYADSIAQVRGQLAMFNLLENKTSLALQDIAKAFPELTAASTSFGLSMTEASALIIPMVASGFQVGASANSVKVSLQRLVAMTKKNQEAIKELKLTQADFNFEAGVGIDTIQKLSDGYENLKRTRGDEGALRFFSDLFGVRQGPRMEVALQNLSQFQSQISKAGTIEDQLTTQLESYVRQRAGQAGLGEKYSKMELTKYSDLSKVIRLSQNADKEVASAFTSARSDFGNYLVSESKKGQDLLGKVTTETGRALFAAASGGGKGSQAEATFNVELEKALDTADRRYKTSRESLKALGREMVPVFDAILKVIVPLLQKFATFVQSMPTGFKAFLTIGALVLAMLGPIMKIRGAFAQLHSSVLSFRASGGVFKNLKSSIHPISAELLASSDAFLRFKNKLTQVGNQFFFKGTIKELKQMEKLIAAQSSGRTRVADRIEKKLKLKETADYSGLYEETSNQLKNVFDESLDGYLKPYSGIKPDITGTIIDGRVVGLEMGNAFVSVLTSLGFDPRSFTRVASTAGTSSSTADDAVVVPANIRRTGSRTTPPADDDGPDGGPSGSGPSGGSPSGGSPAGGSPAGGATRTGPRVRNPMSGMEQVWGTLEETMNFVNSATKKQLQDFAKSLSITKVSGLGVTSAKLKVTTLRRAILEAINAPKELVEKIAEDVKTTAEQVKETVNNNAPPATDTTEVKEASTKATENVAEAQADVNTTAVVEKGKEDKKVVEQTKPKTGRKATVKKASEDSAEKVDTAQAKANAKAVEERGKVDAAEVSSGPRTIKARLKRKPFLKVDKNLEGTIGAFSHLTSTINEMVANAQQVQKISVEEAIAKLNLGIENSKKLRFTPRDFTRLAELMGVILPQAFYEIQEFTNAAGKPLQIQAASLQNIINAIAEIVPASESLPELAGKKVLRIEEDLNRAFIALEKQGGTKAFNIGNAVGTLRHTLNEAINMMIPKENLKLGQVIPLEELTYSDLGTGGRRSRGRKVQAKKLDYDSYVDSAIQFTKTSTGTEFWRKLRKNLQLRAGKSLFEKSMTEESLNQSFGPATGEVTEGNVRVVKSLSARREKSRGAKALFRREIDFKSSLDALTEEQYNAHRAKIEKGIAEARSRMDAIKKLSGAGIDIETEKFSVDELRQAYADFEREMREGALNQPIGKVIEKLKGQSEIISKNRNRPGRLTSDSGDVIFDLPEILNDRLQKAKEALKFEYGEKPIPEGRIKASTQAVFVQIAKDLNYAYMEQLAKFQRETKQTTQVAGDLEIAQGNVDSAEERKLKVKNTLVNSEEGKELFKDIKKTELLSRIQREIDLLKSRRDIIQKEYNILLDQNKANQENIFQLGRVREEQLAILNIKRQEYGLKPTTISAPAVEDTSPTSSERAEAYRQKLLEDRKKEQKQESAETRVDAIATPAAPSNTVGVIREIPKDVDKAQRKLQQLFDVKQALQAIHEKKLPLGKAGEKMEASVKKFFKVETLPKDLFDFFEKINKEIEKAKTALNKAQTAAGSGGGRAGSVNLGMPMAGGFGDPMSTDLSPRGGRRSPLDMMTPRNIMSMIPSGGDLTPDLSGVIETLFKQISQAIGAPAEVMAGVLKDIDDRAKKVSTIVNTSLDQFDNELVNKLITQIQGLLGDSDLTIENIYNAILNARTQIYGMAPKEIKGNIISGKATAEQVSGLVDALQLYNVSKEELLKLDARTLRKIAEKMKLEGRSKANEAKLAELIHNAIFNLDKETINAIDLVSLMPVVEAGAAVKTTAQRAPKKPVQQKIKEEVVKLEDAVDEVVQTTVTVIEDVVVDTTTVVESIKLSLQELMTLSPFIKKYGITVQDIADVSKFIKQAIQDASSLTLKGANEAFATLKTIKNDSALTAIFLQEYGIDVASAIEDIRIVMQQKRKELIDSARTAVNTATSATPRPRNAVDEAMARADAARGGTPVSIRTGQSVVDYRSQDKFVMGVLKVMDASILAGKAVGSFYLSVMRATTMMLPFGKTVWNIGSGFVSLTQSAIALYKSSKEAGTGLKGVGKSLAEIAKAKILGGTYTNARGEQVQSAGVLGRLGGTAGSIKQAFSGAAGTGIQGLINTATMGMGQFGMVAGNVLQNLTSALQTIPYVGGPVVGILGAITGSIYLLVKSSKVWKGTNEEAFNNFKDAWQNIKDILAAIATPFEDFIGTLLGAPEDGANATDRAKSKLVSFSEFILNLSNKIEVFITNYIVPAIRRSLEIVIYLFNVIKPLASATVGLIVAIFNQITNKQENVVKKAGEIFRQSTQEASAANFRMVDNALSHVETVSEAWDEFKKAFGKVWEAITNIVQYYLSIIYLRAYMFLNLAMSEILQTLISLFFNAGQEAANSFASGLSKIKLFGLPLFGREVVPEDGMEVAPSIYSRLFGAGESATNSLFDAQQKEITKKFKALIKKIENSGEGKAAFNKLLESLMPEGSGSGLLKSFRNLLTKVFKDPTAANAAADEFEQAVTSALSNLKQNFFNAALSGLSDAISKIKSEVAELLDAQKEEYLKAYDDQIAAIDAMVEAEQRLTATEEYEANKRQRIKDRELQKNNYQKNRALAIYEGRIDDARQLDLEEQKNISDYNKENADAETARARELQGNARADAKSVIEKQRLEASKLFDQAIKDFNEYVELVGKDGTLTEAQLTEQWKKISEEAEKTSKGLYETFKASFESLPGAISAVTGSSSGLFDIPYDKLIAEAKKQFGIGNTNSESILGLTRSMLTGQGTTISNAFATNGAITKAYSEGLNKLKAYIATKNSGEGENSLKGIFKKIIKDANEAARQEILKGQTGLGSAFDLLVGRMNKSLETLALKEIVAKQIKEAAQLAANTTIPSPRVGDTISPDSRQPRGEYPTGDPNAGELLPNYPIGQWWSRSRPNSRSNWALWKKFPEIQWPEFSAKATKNPTTFQIKFLPRSVPVDPNNRPNTGNSVDGAFFKGGAIPYGNGGSTKGPMHQGIPAILHGGEYVVRKSAVDKYGTGMLQNINQGTFGKKGGFFTGGRVRGSSLDVPGLNMGTDPNFNTTRDIIRSQYTNFYSGLQSLSPSRDRALYEWQVSMGGLNYNYMREIWRKEAKSWTNNRTKSGRPTEGSYAGGGLGISYKNWKTWGGLEFADYPFNANPYQQMVVYNRMIALGYKGQYGVKEKAMTAAQRIKKSYDGKLAAFHFGSKELYDNDAFVNEYTPSNPAKKGQDKTYNSIIISEKDGVGYTTTGSAGVREFFPISRLKNSKGKRFNDLRSSFYRPFSLFTGGLVGNQAQGDIGSGSIKNSLKQFPDPPSLSKKVKKSLGRQYEGFNIWQLLRSQYDGKSNNKESFINYILGQEYDNARSMIGFGNGKQLPIREGSIGMGYEANSNVISSLYKIFTYSKKPDLINKDIFNGKIYKDSKFADYYRNISEIAYSKVYPVVKFSQDYLSTSPGENPKSIENIPQSPSVAFEPFLPLSIPTIKNYEKNNGAIKTEKDVVKAMASYLGFNNKFKKLNVGFTSIFPKNSEYNKFDFVKMALNIFKNATGMPFNLYNKYIDIPFKKLEKNNELQLNINGVDESIADRQGFEGYAKDWYRFKNTIGYADKQLNLKDNVLDRNYFVNIINHELGHIMGMYHTMKNAANRQNTSNTILNEQDQSIMSYNRDYQSRPGYLAGDIAYFQALRKAVGYKTPSIPKKFNGGIMPYGNGGPTTGPMHQGIPAVLHGGEYVVRKSAVDKYGSGMLQSINQGTFGKKGGYFGGGMVQGYQQGGPVDNNGLPLPIPTPAKPGVGKPPKPYKTWAEYFAAQPQVSRPTIPWSKENEKEFKDYIRHGYVDQKTGIFMPPKGKAGGALVGGEKIIGSKNFTQLPAGFRWQETPSLGGKNIPSYQIGPLTGTEATYKGGPTADKDYNVWNQKAEFERLSGEGFLSPFKNLGYRITSLATDAKFSIRRALSGEATDTLLNKNAPATAKLGAGLDFLNLLGVKPKTPKDITKGMNIVKDTPRDIIEMIQDPITGVYRAMVNSPLSPELYKKPFANQLNKAPWPKNPKALELYKGKIKPINWMVERKGWMGGIDRAFVDQRMIAEIYKIANEKVTFGLPDSIKLSDKTIKNIPKNPFAITGLDPNTPEGVKAAYDYFVASQVYTESTGYGGKIAMNYIEALLYASTKGDMAAALEYNSWVGLGKKTVKTRMNEWSPKTEISGNLLQGQKNLGIHNLNLEDLFVVHETPYKPQMDSKGNAIVRPTEDFQTHFPSTRWQSVSEYVKSSGLSTKEWKKSFYRNHPHGTIQGDKFLFDERGDDAYRSTIHTSLNHLVTGHGQRESKTQGYIIISKLTDMLKANPGALSNLYSVDTWWTPAPGKGLVFPGANLLEINSDTNMSDVVNNVIRRRLTPEQLAHPELIGNNRNLIIPGGVHGSDAYWETLIRNMGHDLGVTSHPHFESPSQKLTNIENGVRLGNNIGSWYELTPNDIARMYALRSPISGLNKRVVEGPLPQITKDKVGRTLQGITSMPKRPGTALEKAKTREILPYGNKTFRKFIQQKVQDVKKVSNSLVLTRRSPWFPQVTGTKALPAPAPEKTLNELTMLARGYDLVEMIASGVIDSTLATKSGYISNKALLDQLGISSGGFDSYNRIRSEMQASRGALRGNANYGIVRRANDFLTAGSYSQFHMNISEMGAFLGQDEAVGPYHFQRQMDDLLGAVWIDLKPNPRMTYTVGDSWNMYIRDMSNAIEEGRPRIGPYKPANVLPKNIDDIPLAHIYGQEVIPAHGRYTEVQFPKIPFDSSAIKQITILRKDFSQLDKWDVDSIRGDANYGWGAQDKKFVGIQERLIHQRELAKQASALGIKVNTGVEGPRFDVAVPGVPKMDKVPLHRMSDKAFNNMLRGITKKIKKLQEEMKIHNQQLFSDESVVFNGGRIPYAKGGPTFGPEHQGIPAILHGGEYVIRKSSVDKYGRNMLQNINQGIYKKAGQYKIGGYVDGINTPSIPKFSTPMAQYAKIAGPNVSTGTMQSESTHNYNFYVDNFIGETEWFNSMMKDYNMKVVPANQKQAGLESRVIRTYNGINRGM
jgi:hypothetical protein